MWDGSIGEENEPPVGAIAEAKSSALPMWPEVASTIIGDVPWPKTTIKEEDMKVRQALTKATRSMTWLNGPWNGGEPSSGAVPVTERHHDRQIARDRGEWYLHTVTFR